METIFVDKKDGSREMSAPLVAGCHALAELVRPNFGPSGRNTIYDQENDIALIVNDGSSILPQIELEEKQENTGAALLREAAVRTGKETGDGTIATILMADAMIQDGYRRIEAGVNPMQLRREIQALTPVVLEELRKQAMPAETVEVLTQAAAIAAGDEEVGALAAKLFREIGTDGNVFVEDSQEPQTRIEIYDGVRYEYGLLSAAFVTDRVKRTATLSRPAVLLVNQKIKSIHEIEKVMTDVIRNDVPILIIAEDMEQLVQEILFANIRKNHLQIVVGKGPGHGDTRRRNMQALAAKTGAVLIDENCGLELKDCGMEICGAVEEAVLDKDQTLLRGFPREDAGAAAQLQRRVDEELRKNPADYEVEKLRGTQAILAGKGATVYAGGMVEYEMFEQKHKIENALAAVRSAMREGVVPGGGVAWLQVLPVLEKRMQKASGTELHALQCVCEALKAPVKTIAENTGVKGGVILAAIRASSDRDYGYDAARETWGNMRDAGIIDAVHTDCIVWQSAVSIATTVLTAGAAVYRPAPGGTKA